MDRFLDSVSGHAREIIERQARAAKLAVEPEPIMRGRVMTAREAAAYLGYSLVHFRRLYRSGLFPPPLKLSERKLGWRTGDVLDFLEMKAKAA